MAHTFRAPALGPALGVLRTRIYVNLKPRTHERMYIQRLRQREQEG
jgi:hypothetical protein